MAEQVESARCNRSTQDWTAMVLEDRIGGRQTGRRQDGWELDRRETGW